MKYYVKPYPNPRADDGETSGYWQRRSQVFGNPILNPNPEKVDLDGDGIVEAKQARGDKPMRPEKLLVEESGLVSFAGRKPGRKINFDKTEIGADGKITLELTANDIDRLVQDLSHLGGENIATFGRNASVTIDARRLAELETLDSLAFGHTPKPNQPKTQPDAPLTPQPKDGRKVSFDKADVDASGKIALDLVANDINQLVRDLYDIGVDGIITFGNTASVKIDASKIPALEQLPSLAFGRTTQRESHIEDENQRGDQNKSQTKVGDSAGQDNREASTAGVVSLSAPKEASQDNKGADLSVTRVKRQPRGESDLFNARQTGASGFTSGGTPGMVVTRGERRISYDGINFTSWKEGTPQPMPTESKPSTTIVIRSASFEDQARQPAGLTRNAFGQPIPRPRFTSTFQTVGGSSSGGSSNSQVRAGSSASGRSSNSQVRRLSAEGQRVQ